MPPIAMNVNHYRTHRWRPDRDYLAGEAIERHSGLMPHSIVLSNLCGLLGGVPGHHGLLSARVSIQEDRFRCIDFCLVPKHALSEDVIRTAPLLCVEVLQHESVESISGRLQDYRQLGCTAIWVFDPFRLEAWVVNDGKVERLSHQASACLPSMSVRVADVFDGLPALAELTAMLEEPYEMFTEER